MMSRKLLALDLGTTTGWAEGPIDPRDGPILTGSFRLGPEGAGHGARFGALLTWLADRFQVSRPDTLAYEAPLDPRILSTAKATIRLLNGLPAIVEVVCDRRGLWDVREAEVGDIRHYWLGRRNISGTLAKPAIRQRLIDQGYEVKDYDASDALALHRYISACINPGLRTENAPLLLPKKGQR